MLVRCESYRSLGRMSTAQMLGGQQGVSFSPSRIYYKTWYSTQMPRSHCSG